MGSGRTVRSAIALSIAVGVSAGDAGAGVVTLGNGVTGEGHFDVDVDDYGSYGRQQGVGADDFYWPAGALKSENVSYMSGVFMFVTTPGDVRSVAYLTTQSKLWWYADGMNGDGLAGAHTALARTVTTPISGNASMATSGFRLTDAPSGLQIDTTLTQRFTGVAPIAGLEQDYVVTNNGTVATDLVFFAFAEYDLYYLNSNSQYDDDNVGAGPGLCYVFMHDPGNTQWSATLGDNGSTTPMSSYFAGKEGVIPDASGPAFATMASSNQWIWNSHATATPGIPVTWRNHVATLGYNMAGENDPSVPNSDFDGTIGIEYRFTLAPGASQTVRIERVYGTISLPCPVGPSCGDSVTDPGETCDTGGTNTSACNGETCLAPMCGDGVLNTEAGEQCETIGIDSTTCNGGTCLAPSCGDGYLNTAAGEACDDSGDSAACTASCQPSACGDGYVNVAANEECEDGELCDVTTCTYAFSLGGGCGGCGVRDEGPTAWWLAGLVGFLLTRRGRRARSR